MTTKKETRHPYIVPQQDDPSISLDDYRGDTPAQQSVKIPRDKSKQEKFKPSVNLQESLLSYLQKRKIKLYRVDEDEELAEMRLRLGSLNLGKRISNSLRSRMSTIRRTRSQSRGPSRSSRGGGLTKIITTWMNNRNKKKLENIKQQHRLELLNARNNVSKRPGSGQLSSFTNKPTSSAPPQAGSGQLSNSDSFSRKPPMTKDDWLIADKRRKQMNTHIAALGSARKAAAMMHQRMNHPSNSPEQRAEFQRRRDEYRGMAKAFKTKIQNNLANFDGQRYKGPLVKQAEQRGLIPKPSRKKYAPKPGVKPPPVNIQHNTTFSEEMLFEGNQVCIVLTNHKGKKYKKCFNSRAEAIAWRNKVLGRSLKGRKNVDIQEHKLSFREQSALMRKSHVYGIPFTIISEIYNRGMNEISNPQLTLEQNAFNRVNSFLNSGLAFELDQDLLEGLSNREALVANLKKFWNKGPVSGRINSAINRTEKDDDEASSRINNAFLNSHSATETNNIANYAHSRLGTLSSRLDKLRAMRGGLNEDVLNGGRPKSPVSKTTSNQSLAKLAKRKDEIGKKAKAEIERRKSNAPPSKKSIIDHITSQMAKGKAPDPSIMAHIGSVSDKSLKTAINKAQSERKKKGVLKAIKKRETIAARKAAEETAKEAAKKKAKSIAKVKEKLGTKVARTKEKLGQTTSELEAARNTIAKLERKVKKATKAPRSEAPSTALIPVAGGTAPSASNSEPEQTYADYIESEPITITAKNVPGKQKPGVVSRLKTWLGSFKTANKHAVYKWNPSKIGGGWELHSTHRDPKDALNMAQYVAKSLRQHSKLVPPGMKAPKYFEQSSGKDVTDLIKE